MKQQLAWCVFVHDDVNWELYEVYAEEAVALEREAQLTRAGMFARVTAFKVLSSLPAPPVEAPRG